MGQGLRQHYFNRPQCPVQGREDRSPLEGLLSNRAGVSSPSVHPTGLLCHHQPDNQPRKSLSRWKRMGRLWMWVEGNGPGRRTTRTRRVDGQPKILLSSLGPRLQDSVPLHGEAQDVAPSLCRWIRTSWKRQFLRWRLQLKALRVKCVEALPQLPPGARR